MDNDKINELRNKLNIVDVISSYIPLTKKGRNYFGLCPFHDDHTPSLSVSPDKQIYKCFVCGESGNVFNFVMNFEHISFPEAINNLAKSIGMDMGITIKKENNSNNKYYDIMDIANKFYQNNLLSKEGAKAREYLKNRKLTDEIIKEFEIGLSLNKHDSLTRLLLNKGNSLEELNLIDLSNTNHDSFINRVIFPLHNKDGKVVGFSGRIYDNSDLNKYQNTKETPIFKKGENLFNYHRARDEIRKKKYVIVMEGFMAVIRAYTTGVKNCIATMGTALTKEQASLIKKLSNTIYLCYDGDSAGFKATITSGDEFTKMGCNVFVIPLSDKLDPDDYIIKYGSDAFNNLIENAIPYSEYKIKAMKKAYNLANIDDKTTYVNKVLNEIAKESDEIKCEIMLKNLAKDTDIWYNTLEKKLLEIKDKEKNSKKEDQVVVKKDKKDGYNKAMESLIYYALNYPKAITLIDNSNVYIPNKDIRIILNEIIAYYNKYGSVSEADFYTYLMQKELSSLQDVVKKSLSNDYPNEINDNQVNECLVAIKNYNIALEIKKLEKEIKEEVDIAKQMELMDRILKLKMKEGKSW